MLQWSSSKQNSDGFGGYDGISMKMKQRPDEAVTVKYILSASSAAMGMTSGQRQDICQTCWRTQSSALL